MFSVLSEHVHPGDTLIHGGARGGDTIASAWCQDHPLVHEEVHLADWSRGKGAGFDRNQEMVDSTIDKCLAFLTPKARGTRDCLRRARKANVKDILVIEDLRPWTPVVPARPRREAWQEIPGFGNEY